MHKLKIIALFTISFVIINIAEGQDCRDVSKDYKTSVVQIFTKHDLYYCLGYLHAKDRGWQMDFFRRNVYGDCAETYGFNYVKTDLTMRSLNTRKYASTLWKNLPENQKEIWKYYAEGVNKAYSTEKLGREFKAKAISPPTWTPIDSISIFLLFSLDHSLHSFQYKTQTSDKQEIDLHLPNLYDLSPNFTTFVTSQVHQKSNSTLLATNSNIGLKTPVLWYLSIFKTNNDKPFFGTSIPGIPLFYNGINKNFAWNINHSFPDLIKFSLLGGKDDQVVEKFSPLLWFKYKYFKIPYFYASYYQTKTGQAAIRVTDNKKDTFYKVDWNEYSKVFDSLLKIIETQFQIEDKKMPKNIPHILTDISPEHFKIALIDNQENIYSNGKTYDYKNNFKAKILIPSEYGESDAFYANDLKRERTIDLFNSFPSMTEETARSVLCDNKIEEAKALTPVLIALIQSFPNNENTSKIISSLFSWDQYALLNCNICVFYDVWLRYIGQEFGVPRHKLLNFIKNLSANKKQAIYSTFVRAFRDTTFKNKIRNNNLKPLKHVTIPYFEHLAIVTSEQLSNTWHLAHLLPTASFENTINTLLLKWSPEARTYRPPIGSSMKLIFEFDKNIPKAWVSLSGKNKWYERVPDKVDLTWEDWSKCNFYEIKI